MWRMVMVNAIVITGGLLWLVEKEPPTYLTGKITKVEYVSTNRDYVQKVFHLKLSNGYTAKVFPSGEDTLLTIGSNYTVEVK